MRNYRLLLPHLAVIAPANPDPGMWYPNCAVYAIFDAETLVLVDCGNHFATDSLDAALAALGLDTRRERVIVITHCHIDHSCGARVYAERYRILGCTRTADILLHHPNQVLYEEPEIIVPMPIEAFTPGDTLTFGGITLRTVPGPGHTDDSTIYDTMIDGKRCLFTGDLIMLPGGQLGWPGSMDYSLDKSRATLAWLAEQTYDLILTGHNMGGADSGKVFRAAMARIDG